MSVFKLQAVSLANGSFACTWFDDEQLLWADERLHRAQPTLPTWQPPRLRILGSRPSPILFNPNGFAVSEVVRAALARFSEIEFLPIQIEGWEQYFIMHVVTALRLPDQCSMRRSPVSKNIIDLLSFPAEYAPSVNFFRALQPDDSAAGRAGICFDAIYASSLGREAIVAACKGYLEAIGVSENRRLHSSSQMAADPKRRLH